MVVGAMRRYKPSVPSSGLFGWNALPPELQRRVLASPNLSLPDLAKMANTSKMFLEVYLEQRAKDELWLARTATSVFGPQLMSTLRRWFAYALLHKSCMTAADKTVFNVGQGEWPDDDALRSLISVYLYVPLISFRGTGEEQFARFCLSSIWTSSACMGESRLSIYAVDSTTELLTIVLSAKSGLSIRISTHNGYRLEACLALSHLVCKAVADALFWPVMPCLSIRRPPSVVVAMQGPDQKWQELLPWAAAAPLVSVENKPCLLCVPFVVPALQQHFAPADDGAQTVPPIARRYSISGRGAD
eukprot:jgi/Botrbrau1/5951/Bobra.0366s0121.1